jgi:protein-arginine kinase activator protein McsA
MKCSRCGKDASIAYSFLSDGVEKNIFLCNNCLRDILTFHVASVNMEGLQAFNLHAELLQDYSPDEGMKNLVDWSKFFYIGPLITLISIFEEDNLTLKRTKSEIIYRRNFILKKMLEKAILEENFEKAKELRHLLENN